MNSAPDIRYDQKNATTKKIAQSQFAQKKLEVLYILDATW